MKALVSRHFQQGKGPGLLWALWFSQIFVDSSTAWRPVTPTTRPSTPGPTAARARCCCPPTSWRTRGRAQTPSSAAETTTATSPPSGTRAVIQPSRSFTVPVTWWTRQGENGQSWKFWMKVEMCEDPFWFCVRLWLYSSLHTPFQPHLTWFSSWQSQCRESQNR